MFQLTFFDFFEALINCTLILMLEKDEPQVDSVDNKIKTIKSDLTIKRKFLLSCFLLWNEYQSLPNCVYIDEHTER